MSINFNKIHFEFKSNRDIFDKFERYFNRNSKESYKNLSIPTHIPSSNLFHTKFRDTSPSIQNNHPENHSNPSLVRFREIENNNHPHPSNESSWILFIPLLPIHPTIYTHTHIYIYKKLQLRIRSPSERRVRHRQDDREHRRRGIFDEYREKARPGGGV